jgi:hypothetical protein
LWGVAVVLFHIVLGLGVGSLSGAGYAWICRCGGGGRTPRLPLDKVDAVRARVWILHHLKVVCGEAKGPETQVAKILEFA